MSVRPWQKAGPPPAVKAILAKFGSGKEEDKLVGYLSFLKIGMGQTDTVRHVKLSVERTGPLCCISSYSRIATQSDFRRVGRRNSQNGQF